MTSTANPVATMPAGIIGMRLAASAGPAGAGTPPRTPPSVRANVLEWLEDAVLLLLIVFSVPVVIVLLTLPIGLLIRIAEQIGPR
jgi:hypothetical protein